jgi:hypothetical protein
MKASENLRLPKEMRHEVPLLVLLRHQEVLHAVRANRPTVSDAPFSGAQEQVGAFFVVEADNVDEATRIASLHPGAHLGKYFGGGIEVRACEMFEQY